MRSPTRSALLASLVFGLSPHASAEHGDPGYAIEPAPDLILPTDSSIILRGFNGVPFSLEDLRKMAPRLKGEAGDIITLRMSLAYDDMEGRDEQPSQRFSAGEGYGESIVVWRPTKRMRPGSTYTLIASEPDAPKETFVLGGPWTTGPGPAHSPPRWSGAPTQLARHPGQPPDEDWPEWGAAISLPLAYDPLGALLRVEITAPASARVVMWAWADPTLWREAEASYRCAQVDHHRPRPHDQTVTLKLRPFNLSGQPGPTRHLTMRWRAHAPGLSLCIPS